MYPILTILSSIDFQARNKINHFQTKNNLNYLNNTLAGVVLPSPAKGRKNIY